MGGTFRIGGKDRSKKGPAPHLKPYIDESGSNGATAERQEYINMLSEEEVSEQFEKMLVRTGLKIMPKIVPAKMSVTKEVVPDILHLVPVVECIVK